MSRLMTLDRIRALERSALAGLPAGTLLGRAAQALAEEAARVARDLPAPVRFLVLAGPGNNGADALLAGWLLAEQGFVVNAVRQPVAAEASKSRSPEAAPSPGESGTVVTAYEQRFGPLPALGTIAPLLKPGTIVIDGLLGIGQRQAVRGAMREAILAVNAARLPVIAVDVPTGVDSDRGALFEPEPLAFQASSTVTMLADKPGLHTGAALEHCGRVVVAALGVAAAPDEVSTANDDSAAHSLADSASPADGELIDAAVAATLMRPRARNTHKGSFGSVLVVGGATGMTGAALLAASGAQAGGAGKVFLCSDAPAIGDPANAQWLVSPWPPALDAIDAVAIGCGMGTGPRWAAQLQRVIESTLPVVFDADALNLIATMGRLERPAGAPSLLTPHPLEAARLLGCPVAQVQADRRAAALSLAQRLGAVVALKGAGTVCAAPDGRWAINASGAPTLASAGTGDVLAGLLAALLAQGYPAWDAVRLAVWAHGRGGELMQHKLPFGGGMAATELFETIRTALNSR